VAVFAFPPAIGKTIHTTNAEESLNRSLRRAIETGGGFATGEAKPTLQ
jgi:transposase-like protein